MFTNADTSDFVGSVRCTAPGPFTGVAVELDAGNRIFTTLPVVPVDRTEGTNKEAFLDFAHFANGTGITSSLVFVNVSAPQRAGSFTLAGQLVRPALYFYDKEGNPIAAESVVDVMGDLEVTEDGTLTVRKKLAHLGELTISTHGRGEVVTGSVKVVADGPIGGVLRFGLPGIGVAGVGVSQPVRDAIFPARRQEGGISTAAAIHNLGEEAMVVSCQLMKDGAVLEEEEIPLEANGRTPGSSSKYSQTPIHLILWGRCVAPHPRRGRSPEWPWSWMPPTASSPHCRWYRWRDDFPGIDEGTGALAASSTWFPSRKGKNRTLRKFADPRKVSS